MEGSRGFCWWVARAWAGGRAVCPCARTPSSPPTLFPVAPPPHSPQYGGWAGDQVVRDYSAYADLVFTEFGRKARAGGGVEGSRAFAGCVRRWGGGCEGRHGGERGAAGRGPATPARPPARPPPPSPPCTPHLPPPQVKNWSTFNEPRTFCTLGYGVGAHAPGIKARNWGVLEVGRGGGLRQAGGGGGAVRARTRALAARLLGQPFTPSSPPTHPQSTEQTWQCVQHVLEAHAKAAKHFRVKVGRLGWPAGALGKGPAARPLRRCAAAPRTLDPRPGFQPNPGPEPGPNPDLEPDRATPHLTLPLPTFAHVQVPGGKLSMNLDGEWGEPFTGSDADKASGGVRGWEGWGWRRGARSAPSEASRAGALLGPAPTPSHCPPTPRPPPTHPARPPVQEAAQTHRDYNYGIFADPIYFGKYPDSVVKNAPPGLGVITPELAAALKGSLDLFSFNAYTTRCGGAGDGVVGRVRWLPRRLGRPRVA